MIEHDYFKLFDIPAVFEIDIKKLCKRYQDREGLIARRILDESVLSEKKVVIEEAALLLKAYNTLMDPCERALYLCRYRGYEVDDYEPEVTPTFRMASMNVIKSFEEATHQDPNYKTLHNLLHRLIEETNDIIKEISLFLEEDDPQYLPQIINTAHRLKFYLEYQEKLQWHLYSLIQKDASRS